MITSLLMSIGAFLMKEMLQIVKENMHMRYQKQVLMSLSVIIQLFKKLKNIKHTYFYSLGNTTSDDFLSKTKKVWLFKMIGKVKT